MNKVKYNLFLDDERVPNVAGKYMKTNIYFDLDWEIKRSYEEFVEMITTNGLPEIVSFDHDLADAHYDPATWTQGFKYKEKTGMDCAKWLVDYCMDNKLKFPQWLVHSMNPVGSKNIISYIQNYLNHSEIDSESQFTDAAIVPTAIAVCDDTEPKTNCGCAKCQCNE